MAILSFRKLVILFSLLVALAIIQLFSLSFKSVGKVGKVTQLHLYHVNFTKQTRTINENRLSLQNQVTAQDISTSIPSTSFIIQTPTTATVLLPLTFPQNDGNQVTTAPKEHEKDRTTSQQQTDRLQSKTKRFRPDNKMPFINEFDKAGEVKEVDVLLIIVTYHKYFHRRKNSRKTWLTSCHKHLKIACWFFTDSLEVITDPMDRKRILKEQEEHKDIIFTSVGNGIKFGLRFLHLLMWGKANYNFKYIARVDDDMMVCIDHLMWDLPNFPSTNFHYGWMHCQMPNVVFIDECFSMYSNDLVEKFLSQKGDKIMCHPFGGLQVAVWEHLLGIEGSDVYRPDNDRIHHHPPASFDNGMKTASNICEKFIAIHGVYKDDALDFWKRRGNGHFNKYPAKKPLNFCPHYPTVDIYKFSGIYHQTPKLCSADPRWKLGKHIKYSGREV